MQTFVIWLGYKYWVVKFQWVLHNLYGTFFFISSVDLEPVFSAYILKNIFNSNIFMAGALESSIIVRKLV